MSPRRPRRLSKRRWLAASVIACVAVLMLLDRSGWLLVSATDDVGSYDGRAARVTRVIDGDTLEIELPDASAGRERTRIRLWGVDCPEMASRDAAAEHLAVEAAAFARVLAGDAIVVVRLERHQTRDRYDRLLAHVELPDGSILNRELIAAGLGRADARTPHARTQQYAQAELIARRAKLGLWSR